MTLKEAKKIKKGGILCLKDRPDNRLTVTGITRKDRSWGYPNDTVVFDLKDEYGNVNPIRHPYVISV